MEHFWQKLRSFTFQRHSESSATSAVAAAISSITPVTSLPSTYSPLLPPETLAYLQTLIGSLDGNARLYQTALTHRSVIGNTALSHHNESNQRLEFLGDAVLGLLISHFLFQNFPASAEGDLSKTRAKIVNSKSLACFARSIGLGEHLLLGESAAHYNIRDSESALADAFESLIGAIYLDKGLDAAYGFVDKHIIHHQSFSAIVASEQNYKSCLIEYSQAHHVAAPVYTVIAEHGAEHDKEFTVEVSCNNIKGCGTARRKKDAEQLAAKEAMERIIALQPLPHEPKDEENSTTT